MIDFTKLTSYKKVPNQEDGACFVCSPVNEKGLKMKFYTDEESVFFLVYKFLLIYVVGVTLFTVG